MKLTKFQHACLCIEKDSGTILVDPGSFTHDFIMPKKLDAIIITHEHPDHLDTTLMQKILTAHPKAVVIGHESITAKYATQQTIAVTENSIQDIAGFHLQFVGGTHAPIAEGIITPPNFGVIVDESLYYPGDAFTVPEGHSITTLALPISAPWLNFAQTRTFLQLVKPEFVFPTHDALLSEDGKKLMDTMIGGFAESLGIRYQRLDTASIDT